jgi:hypothetical protein
VSSPKHERIGPDGVGAVPYLPLTTDAEAASEQSIGRLVGDATQHLSTLVRAEVELAKAEAVREVKKGLQGTVFFLIALTVGLYSTFFLFFFFGELLSEWLKRWAAFLIVFGAMLAVTGVTALIGWRRFKKVRAPERTIRTLKETAGALKPARSAGDDELPALRD